MKTFISDRAYVLHIWQPGRPKDVTKETAGNRGSLTRSPLGCGILRRFFLLASSRRSISAALRCEWLVERSLNLGFVGADSREKDAAGAGAVLQDNRVLRFFPPALLPPLSRRGLRTYDSHDAKPQPLARANLAISKPSRLPDSLVCRPRSTRYLELCHPRRYAPSHGKLLRKPAKTQNSGSWTTQLAPLSSVPLQQGRIYSGLERQQTVICYPLVASHATKRLVQSWSVSIPIYSILHSSLWLTSDKTAMATLR